MKIEGLNIIAGLEEAFWKIFQPQNAETQNVLLSRITPASTKKKSALALRSLFVLWESLWDSFTQTRKDAWQTYWSTLPFGDHSGLHGWPGSGYSAFVYVNAPRYKLGLPLLLDPLGLFVVMTDLYHQVQGVCYSPELGFFVGCGTYGSGFNVIKSNDGFVWSQVATPVGASLVDIIWVSANQSFYAVDYNNVTNWLYTSSDGINWNNHVVPSCNYVWRICYSPELAIFVAGTGSGGSYKFLYSYNGTTWFVSPSSNTIWCHFIEWSPELGIFCAGGISVNTRRFYTSSDGINWIMRLCPDAVNPRDLAWSPKLGLFCCCKSSLYNGSRFLTSPDGIHWTGHLGLDGAWYSIEWSPELEIFLCVANSNYGNASNVAYSYNGFDWFYLSPQIGFSANRIIWCSEQYKFLALASTGDRVLIGAPAL